MLLTKSCFNPALLRSDLRRCWPLFAGYTFLWFLILPLRMWNGVAADLQASHPEDARRVALEIIGNATTAAIWIHLIFGIVLAMALFSYLSSARGTYGMHSFPASRGCQFRTHVLSCVGCVAVSNVLICLLSAQSGGTHWGASLSWLVFSLVTFLLFFSLGIFCCMLCGWLPAMAVAYGAVNCVAIFCRILAGAMCSIFYPSYNDTVLSMGRNHIVAWLTPVLRLHQDLYEMYKDGSGPLLSASAWKSLLVYGIGALVLLVAGALLYRIRRSEASGDTLSFRPLRPVVRWAVGLLGGLGLGLVLTGMLNCTYNTPALLACIGQGKDAARAALAHSCFNLSGSLLAAVLLPWFVRLVEFISPKGPELEVISRQIANAHTAFNVCCALLWLPFLPWMVRLVCALVPEKEKK